MNLAGIDFGLDEVDGLVDLLAAKGEGESAENHRASCQGHWRMLVRQRPVGAMTFVSAESGRHYSAGDLQLAKDVASRAALAVDNARAYAEARRASQ